MKISKVNHIKTGVSELPIDAGGMMYFFPESAENKVQLRKYIKDLCEKTQNLYKVLVVPKAKDDNSIDKEICNTLNIYIKNYVTRRIGDDWSDDSIYYYMTSKVFKAYPVVIDYKEVDITENKIKNAIDRCLRQSLRKKCLFNEKSFYIPDVIKRIGVVAFARDNYMSEIKSVSKDEIMALIKAIREDYTKENIIENVAKSIEKQNVPVQISKVGEKFVLSGSFNKKKSYIFDFVKQYASDENGQTELLKHMKYLMLLYFYGKNIADDAFDDRNFGAWNYGITLNEYKEILFSGEAADIIAELNVTPTNFKGRTRNLKDQYRLAIQKSIEGHYKSAIDNPSISDMDKRWIGFISDRAERKLAELCKTKNRDAGYKLTCKYLIEEIWDEWTSYIAMKYVDIGKAVYHFAMEDRYNIKEGKPVSFGKLDIKNLNGLSSFDYERIKASDSFSRNLASYVLFAINNFDSAVRSPEERKKSRKEDILSDNSPVFCNDAKKRVLRFFGGASNYLNTDIDEKKFIKECIDCLCVARNTSFHFVSGEKKFDEINVLKKIFDFEKVNAGRIYRKRIYSNNIPKFYSINDINAFMTNIYTRVRNTPAQIPSYNKILSRNEMRNFIGAFIPFNNRAVINKTDTTDVFENSFYFILKEIYYYDFIHKSDILSRFMKAVNSFDAKDKNEQRAHRDFKKRVKELIDDGYGFGEICQEIMTEYNLQNNQKSKTPSAIKTKDKDGKESIREIKDDKKIYKHYTTLLYLGLRQAFYEYVNEGKYDFLKKPSERDMVNEEDFISSWNTNMYDSLDLDNSVLVAWYLTAHFLNQRQLNHLIGQFKTYVSYIDSIEKRAKLTGNQVRKETEENKVLYLDMITVFEFVKLYCGSISNKIEDYFANADDYAKYVSEFIDFGGEDKKALQAFCNKKYAYEGNSVSLGKYYDAMNPILDRNIVLSSMYGNKEILSAVVDKVTENEIEEYYTLKGKIAGIMSKSTSDKTELNILRNYQNLKNRIELVDVLSLTELTTSLISQLIRCASMRERDLMYYQLGYYYIKLFHTNSVESDSFLRKLKGDCDIEEGAVLYQIAAMYSYDLPLYERDENGIAHAPKKATSIANSVKKFSENYCRENKESGEAYKIYKAGLNLFENIDGYNDGRHDEYVALREYIDHLKFFAYHDESILQLYSKLYGGFFSYSTKLRKSISYVLPNILLSDFVNVKLRFDYIEETRGNVTYRVPNIVIKEIASDYLSYKEFKSIVSSGSDVLKDTNKIIVNEDAGNKNFKKEAKGKTVSVPARSKAYLDAVSRLLVFKVI